MRLGLNQVRGMVVVGITCRVLRRERVTTRDVIVRLTVHLRGRRHTHCTSSLLFPPQRPWFPSDPLNIFKYHGESSGRD